MANRETYPASQSPLTGDISGPAGARQVTVTGIQGVPVKASGPTTPTDQDKLVYQAANEDWEPTADSNVVVTLGTYTTLGGAVTSKGITLSDDRMFSVNNIAIDGLVGWSLGSAFDIFVNGTGVL